MVYHQFTVRIPADAHVHMDRVIVITASYPVYTRRNIGKVCGEGVMHPNQLYFQLYPEEWKEQYPDQAPLTHQRFLGTGLFALVLGIGAKTKLYSSLNAVYSPDIVNGLMDLVLLHLLSCCDSEEADAPEKENQLFFSILPRALSWYTDLFSCRMDEQHNQAVRAQWLQSCLDTGLRDVCLSIDRTGLESTGKSDTLNSGENGTDQNRQTSCIWVISAQEEACGLPLTYFTTEGNGTDTKDIRKILVFLKQFGLHLKGVLADYDSCTQDVFQLLHDLSIDYVIRLKESGTACKDIFDQYADALRMEDPQYVLNDGHKYGTVEKNRRLFPPLDLKDSIALLYNPFRGVDGRMRFMEEITSLVHTWNEEVQNGAPHELPQRFREWC